MKKLLTWAAVVLGGLIILTIVVGAVAHEPRPDRGETGPVAEAVADRMERAVDAEAWSRTGAIGFRFFGNSHLWDKERGLSRVRWDDTEVLQHLDRRAGIAIVEGEVVHGARRDALIESAYQRFCNDTFWLSAHFKARDDGVTRSVVPLEGDREGLFVEYASGGSTPGDAYLWVVGDDGLPREWQMWVSVLPIGGIRATWEDWITLPTGARIATMRRIGPFDLPIEDVEGGASWADIEPGTDPFDALISR